MRIPNYLKATLAAGLAVTLAGAASAQQSDPTGGGTALKSIDPQTGKASPAVNPAPGGAGAVEHHSAEPGQPTPRADTPPQETPPKNQ